MSILLIGRDRVRTLRAVGRTVDARALQRRIERVVGAASLQPRGVSSRAIVCVRHLRVNGRTIEDRAWPGKLEDRMTAIVASAARPFMEVVPAGAQAVVFRDEAELLACLLADAGRRRVGAWWWRTLFAADSYWTMVNRALVEAAEVLPAAVAQLDRGGIAADVVGRLPAETCALANARLREVFGIVTTNQPLARELAPPRVSDSGAEAQRARAVFEGAVARIAPAAMARLDAEARELLVLSFALATAPPIARSAGFAALIGAWVGNMRQYEAFTRTSEGSADTRTADVVEAVDDRLTPSDAPPPVRSARRTDVLATNADAADRHVGVDVVEDLPNGSSGHAGEDGSRTDRNAVTAAAAHKPTPIALPIIFSRFAGVFYLVNVALNLELFAAFANPSREELPIALGDFLANAGRRVCGRRFHRDPLWSMLAHLAGRDAGERPRVDARWICPIVDRMAVRAAIALGVPKRGALRMLVCRPGQIALNDTRLDVHFPLAEHPLALRVAGIDRNPGWVPAIGRIIEYHYE